MTYRLQQYPVKDRTGLQTIEYLSKRVMALGAKSAGHFLVDCETYVSVPQLGEYTIFIFVLCFTALLFAMKHDVCVCDSLILMFFSSYAPFFLCSIHLVDMLFL